MWTWFSASLAVAAIGDEAGRWESDLQDVRGLTSLDGQLYALDATRGIVRLALVDGRADVVEAVPAPGEVPRGLSLERLDGTIVVTVLDGGPSGPRIGRGPLGGEVTWVDLALLGTPAVFDLTTDGPDLVVTLDPGDDPFRRGVVRIGGGFDALRAGTATLRHLPGSGRTEKGVSAKGRAALVTEIDRVPYLILGAGDQLYVADRRTARGLFVVPMPVSKQPTWGLAVVGGRLYAVERRPEKTDRLIAFDLGADPMTPRDGAARQRTVHTEIISRTDERAPSDPGWLQHTHGTPATIGNQHGSNSSAGPSSPPGAPDTFTWSTDPQAPLQSAARVRWEHPRPGVYQSSNQATVTLREQTFTVLPHLVSDAGLPSPTYIADGPQYQLTSDATWTRFFERVTRTISERYGLTIDEARDELANPYWAARDVTEYVLGAYWYPNEDIGVKATQNLNAGHFAAGPASKKLELSDGRPDGDEVIACAGASTILDAAMRRLGHGARWIGATFASNETAWDVDQDGQYDPGEVRPAKHGHRWAQVWLGERYGWQPFDATPEARADALPVGIPPVPAQWDLMREAAGPAQVGRIVLTVGSGVVDPLLRTFPAPIRGGDQGANLLGKAERPEHWDYPEHRITLTNPNWIEVTHTTSGDAVAVQFATKGPWDLDGGLTVWVERRSGKRRLLSSGLALSATGAAGTLSPGEMREGYRIVVDLDGDPETGGVSAWSVPEGAAPR